MTFVKGQPKIGGRKRGSLNKTTIAKAVGIEHAERQAGRKLAVERMAEAMEYWFEMVELHKQGGPEPDPAEFRRCLKEGTNCARDLAPFQSPKLQSTTLRQDAPKEPLRITMRIVRAHDE